MGMTGRDHPARLLWIGGGSGPEDAVRILPPLRELVPDAELTIMGSETDRAAARRLAGDLRIADRVVTPGDAIGLQDMLRSADLLLVTGGSESARPAVDLPPALGLPTVACSPRPDESTQAHQGALGLYVARAREIALLLNGRAARASGYPGTSATELPVSSREADVAPARQQLSHPPGVSGKASPAGHARPRRADANGRRAPDLFVRLAAAVFDRSPRSAFAPIRTVDLSSLGLGDTLMAWAGLHALLHAGLRPVAPGCAMHVQGALVRTGTALFADHGLRILPATGGDPVDLASPVLSPRSPQNWRELRRGVMGLDWRVNCFPAVDAQKPALRADHRYDPWERFCLGVTERLFHGRQGWQVAPAEYVGVRLWMPVARRLGLFPIAFMALLKQSLPQLRAEMRTFVHTLGRTGASTAIAIFPSGRSYQAFPADFCHGLRARLEPRPVRFYVPADDPWIGAYRDAGLDLVHLDTIEELLAVLTSTPTVITTDSFASHAAQLLRDDFTLVLTRDIRENVLHPGANPLIVTHHPRCAPCQYVPRVDLTSCPARYDRCVAFENRAFLERVAQAASGWPTPQAAPFSGIQSEMR